jgi:hypothetical protein
MTYYDYELWREANPEKARRQEETLHASVQRGLRRLLAEDEASLAGKAKELEQAERRGRVGKLVRLRLEVAALERDLKLTRHALGELPLSDDELDALMGPLD